MDEKTNCSILDLPHQNLTDVFNFLNLNTRIYVLPYVCRHFSLIARDPMTFRVWNLRADFEDQMTWENGTKFSPSTFEWIFETFPISFFALGSAAYDRVNLSLPFSAFSFRQLRHIEWQTFSKHCVLEELLEVAPNLNSFSLAANSLDLNKVLHVLHASNRHWERLYLNIHDPFLIANASSFNQFGLVCSEFLEKNGPTLKSFVLTASSSSAAEAQIWYTPILHVLPQFCIKLKYLTISNLPINDDEFLTLLNCDELKKNLMSLAVRNSRITGTPFLQCQQPFVLLQDLDLSGTQHLTQNSLLALPALTPNLDLLDLTNCGDRLDFSGVCWPHLTSFLASHLVWDEYGDRCTGTKLGLEVFVRRHPHLVCLELNGIKNINDSDILAICQCASRLAYLNLNHNSMTKQGFATLVEHAPLFTSLTRLSLTHSRNMVWSLQHVQDLCAGLPVLADLNLNGCRPLFLTSAVDTFMKQHYPHVKFSCVKASWF
eukprot:TRINITY_DN21434_c0_g1_i1.p1 TRINITY_DN21434_c0_g1~~TRINITY_DN21434_c0_g1_i1.p1  ORF type:complete len:488 (-),score=13.16 TRINITY_DN21434_c0_g1_i1:31-1494(-)